MAAGLKGRTEPRIFTPPLVELTPETSLGFAVIEFAETVLGLELRPWQKWLFIHALELDMTTVPGSDSFDPDTPPARYYDYRFRQVCVLVARQNGKTLLMCVLGLWRLFYDGASEMISTAQNLTVAETTLDDAFNLARSHPEMAEYLPYRMERGKWVPYMRTANGSHRIELSSVPEDLEHVLDAAGSMPAWYVVANNGGGRSYSVDLALLDELREHTDEAMWEAIEPTTSERPRNQIWSFSNAGTARSVVLRRIRNVALKAINAGDTDDERLFLAEWSAEPDRSIFDREGWAEANPSLGYGVRTESDMLAKAKAAVDPEDENSSPDGFRTEYLCQWVESLEPGKIGEDLWASLESPVEIDPEETPVYVGIDVAVEARAAHIAVAFERPDGHWHVEVVASRAGIAWVAEWLEARRAVGFDGRVGMQIRGAPSAALAPLLEDAEIEIVPWQGSEMSGSVLGYLNAIRAGEVHHSGRAEGEEASPTLLEAAAVGVRDRKAGDVFIWDRDKSVGDSTPFIATNIAWWLGHHKEEEFISAYSGDGWIDEDEADEELSEDLDAGMIIF